MKRSIRFRRRQARRGLGVARERQDHCSKYVKVTGLGVGRTTQCSTSSHGGAHVGGRMRKH